MASIFDPNNPTAFNLLGNQQQQPFTISQENYQQPNANANITASANGMNRNQKIGYMLSALSDAFAGRDVAGRAMERAQVMRQQAEVDRQRQEALEQSKQLGTVITNLNIPKSQKDFILSLNQASQADVVSKLMFPVDPKETSAIQEYKFAQDQGYKGTFTDFKTLNKQVTNINVGPQGQDLGDPPKDTAWQRDQEGKVVMDERGIPIALPIQGTPTFAKQQKVLTQETKSGEEVVVTGGVVLGNINQIKNAIENSTLPTTGLGGQILRNIGGTAALDINRLIDPIQASIGFDRLQRMREASPTGGALGQVSERELDLLMATLSSLDQAQSEEQFLQSLDKVETRYKNIIKKFNVYPEQAMLEVGYIPIDLNEDIKVIDGYQITPKK
tara:strand:+ start:252 stop:1412 length:1161 start_codon:yes stop_codon:yes gene_type:complete